jgi:hypothetical protein
MLKFIETLADNVFRHKYSMMQILKKLINGKILGLPRSTPLSRDIVLAMPFNIIIG